MSVTSDDFFKRISATFSASAAALALPAVALSTVGASSAIAAPDYFDCAAGMTEVGISEADAIASCASARYPEDLGACVVDVNEFTTINATNALIVCSRSRRPKEVANCTIDIHEALLDSASVTALERCGTSLLPERYGTCVIDIADATGTSTDNALTQCIRAGFQPWRIRPTEVF